MYCVTERSMQTFLQKSLGTLQEKYVALKGLNCRVDKYYCKSELSEQILGRNFVGIKKKMINISMCKLSFGVSFLVLLTLWMSSPFHESVPKDFFQICLPWRNSVERHSTCPNVKLHTRFLTLWGVNCNVKLHTCVDFVGCKFTM